MGIYILHISSHDGGKISVVNIRKLFQGLASKYSCVRKHGGIELSVYEQKTFLEEI